MTANVRKRLEQWVAEGRRVVHEADAKALLRLAGVPVPARSPRAGRLAVKLASDKYPHKSEHGLVHLDVARRDVAKLSRQLQRKDPDGSVLVERMVEGGVAEWIVGCKRDATFGPVVVTGPGGVLVELLDRAEVRLAPTSLKTAKAVLGNGPGAKLLNGARGRPPGDRDALARLIVAASKFFARHQDLIEEIDLNPVIVLPKGQGVVAADAMLVLRRKETGK
ncbi:MAG: acetate--CoA ligase family protein [Alphaproteobacteria bacterium]|jgi:hypothetical protein|nr:acetate--CoA ligase family protein [Alphaproteobacteria bacterium]